MPKKLKDTYPRLGELLVRKGVATHHHIDQALAVQRAHLNDRKTSPKLGDILVEHKVLSPKVIREILEEQKLGRGEKRTLVLGLREHGDVAIVTLAGRLDQSKQEHVHGVFERLMNRGFHQVGVDCRKLVYLDSHGVSSFVAYVDEARARGGDIKFFALRPEARFTLDRLGLSGFLQVFPTEAETIHAFHHAIDEVMSKGSVGEFIGAADQKQFHFSFCPALAEVHEEDRLYFESRKDAKDAGKTPCRKCKP